MLRVFVWMFGLLFFGGPAVASEIGPVAAIMGDKYLRSAVNVYKGKVTYPAVAEAFDMEYVDAESLV